MQTLEERQAYWAAKISDAEAHATARSTEIHPNSVQCPHDLALQNIARIKRHRDADLSRFAIPAKAEPDALLPPDLGTGAGNGPADPGSGSSLPDPSGSPAVDLGERGGAPQFDGKFGQPFAPEATLASKALRSLIQDGESIADAKARLLAELEALDIEYDALTQRVLRGSASSEESARHEAVAARRAAITNVIAELRS